jgi:hypothetical protein
MSAAGTRTRVISEIDSLALLALKVAPNVFDISSEQHHISIRDQIVRAQVLVRDLRRADHTAWNLLVVGAGVGGAAAAVAAAYANMNVVLVEVKDGPFSLQRGTKLRKVAPFMYEWPSHFYNNQDYPPPDTDLWGKINPAAPTWAAPVPMTGEDLATQLDKWLEDALNVKPRLEFLTGVVGKDVRDYVKDFVATTKGNLWLRLGGYPPVYPPAYKVPGRSWPAGGPPRNLPFTPEYIILAGGMGGEVHKLPGGVGETHFWQDDTLRDEATRDQRVGIFGGGDGALQDVLRALTKFDEPLAMIDKLLTHPVAKPLIRAQEQRLLTLESQSRLFGTWTQGSGSDPSYEVDRSCQAIARELANDSGVRDAVIDCLRMAGPNQRGTVCHYVFATHFDKAYLLNRFLVHLIDQVKRQWGIPLQRMDYQLTFEREAVSGFYVNQPACKVTLRDVATGNTSTEEFDLAVVRFGMVRANQLSGKAGSTSGAQMIQLSEHDIGQRTTLNKVPLPFVIPEK